jgi:hypothetical protein
VLSIVEPKSADTNDASPVAKSSVTSSRPQRAGANTHPGKIVNDAKQKRRTPAQKTADDAILKSARIQAENARVESESASEQQAAALERQFQQAEDLQELYSVRPDVQLSTSNGMRHSTRSIVADGISLGDLETQEALVSFRSF